MSAAGKGDATVNKQRVLSILFSLVLALGFATAPVLAQSGPPPIPGLDAPPERLTDADLARFVTLARQERISVAQTKAFLDRLSGPQKQTVSDQIGVQAGIPLDRWRASIAREAQKRPKLPAAPTPSAAPSGGQIAPMTAQGVWAHSIPNYNGPFPYYNGTTGSYSDQYSCDDDPDTDFIFVFSHDANSLNSLRWNTNSSQVYSAFWAYYGGTLRGFGYNYLDVRLCAGDTGVWAAGGQGWVAGHLYVHYI